MNNGRSRLRGTICLSSLFLLLIAGTSFAKSPNNFAVVIGDSLSDPGNFYALTGFWPPSPPYAMRFTNGPVWAEYFAQNLGISVDNRAYGGAFTGVYLVGGVPTSNFNNVEHPDYFPDPLPGVYEEIEGLLEDNPDGLNPKALYILWAGPNDFFLGLVQPDAMEEILVQAATNIAESVCVLGAAGARHFVIGNLPDIGLTPFARDMGPDAQLFMSATIAQYNAALAEALAMLPQSCADTLTLFDSYQALHEIIAAPGDYGLTNITESCLTGLTPCSAPDEYAFWDSVHPTTRVHEIFADEIRESFCRTGEQTPGLRGRPDSMPPDHWRGICFGTK